MELSWDPSADAAYINLLSPRERTDGVVADSVTLEAVAAKAGLEVLSVRATLPESTLGAAC
ncbi:MAG: hypothetical protein HOQ03_13395 [Thermoleophilia bacterium]|nr:hypothetical protein [Thermoleophilia bacterium]